MSELSVAVQSADMQHALETLAGWGKLVTIIVHGGSVFEFKGDFPRGELGEGYYNLKGDNGFEGHINLNKIATMVFHSGTHRGRESHHLAFLDLQQQTVFKVFIGRDQQGELLSAQVSEFMKLKQQWSGLDVS